MRLAYATVSDATDVRQGSGTWFHLGQEFRRQGHDVLYVGPLDFTYPLVSRVLKRLHRLAGRRYVSFLDPFVGRLAGRQVEARLGGRSYDVMLTNDMAIAAYSHIDQPTVLYTDVMITQDYVENSLPHARLSNISQLSLWLSRKTIRAALERSDLCIFPAEWSADEARYYHDAPHKIAIVPFGANIEDPGNAVAGRRSFARIQQKSRLDLLFVGKDWERKGGDAALRVIRELNERGRRTCLHIVGCEPDSARGTPSVEIHVHGYLDKQKPKDLAKLRGLYMDCDALLLPSSSEGFVIAALEASAYGMPVLAYDTIGVRDAVIEGVNGRLFPLGTAHHAYVQEICSWETEPERYDSLVRGSRRRYEEKVNWKVCVDALEGLIEQQVLGRKL